MELRHLRYFVAVAEERNFTRAAARLHIAQPPLSRQMQQLEEILGVALIEKGSRPLRLTEAGEFFLAHARPLLDRGDLSWSYREMDPDVFGEELETATYASAERIAAVVLTVTRSV